jgi:peroxiredoxin/predicted 2-oxoglutarate/Fe(II)-dependent dioxygenase YbiX
MSPLEVGDRAPLFILPSTVNPKFHFSSVSGYPIVLFFFGSAALAPVQKILKDFEAYNHELEAFPVYRFGISIDPKDRVLNRISLLAPSLVTFWDEEKEVSKKYGVCETPEGGAISYKPQTLILNSNFQVLAVIPIGKAEQHFQEVLTFLKSLPPREPGYLMKSHAPVLLIPKVFDPQFCRFLIDLYQTNGGDASCVMREIEGKTVGILDDNFKKRKDYFIRETKLLNQINDLIWRRVKPEIQKAFQFSITRFERYLVACYDGNTGGYFSPHRDDDTQGTIHRRFAMTLNLNVGEYTGGYLHFPEYAPHGYQGESGDAIVFSCSLLHAVKPVTSGQRFALLSFFYNDEDAKIRKANAKYIVTSED